MSDYSNLNLAFLSLAIIVGILGAFFGSFCSKIIYRLEGGRMPAKAIFSPSICPNCIKKIQVSDKIPIISFIRLKGKCRRCGAPITPRYLVLEIVGMVLPYILLFLKNFDFIVIFDYFFVMSLLCALYISYDNNRFVNLLSFVILLLSIGKTGFNLNLLLDTGISFIVSLILSFLIYTYINKNSRRISAFFIGSCGAYLGLVSSLIVLFFFLIIFLSLKGLNKLGLTTFSKYDFILVILILIDFALKEPVLSGVEKILTFITN